MFRAFSSSTEDAVLKMGKTCEAMVKKLKKLNGGDQAFTEDLQYSVATFRAGRPLGEAAVENDSEEYLVALLVRRWQERFKVTEVEFNQADEEWV